MAEFLIHRRSGMGFPANRAQGKVSCCPSMTLVTEGLIPISGATETDRNRYYQINLTQKEDKHPYRPRLSSLKSRIFKNKIFK